MRMKIIWENTYSHMCVSFDGKNDQSALPQWSVKEQNKILRTFAMKVIYYYWSGPKSIQQANKRNPNESNVLIFTDIGCTFNDLRIFRMGEDKGWKLFIRTVRKWNKEWNWMETFKAMWKMNLKQMKMEQKRIEK